MISLKLFVFMGILVACAHSLSTPWYSGRSFPLFRIRAVTSKYPPYILLPPAYYAYRPNSIYAYQYQLPSYYVRPRPPRPNNVFSGGGAPGFGGIIG